MSDSAVQRVRTERIWPESKLFFLIRNFVVFVKWVANNSTSQYGNHLKISDWLFLNLHRFCFKKKLDSKKLIEAVRRHEIIVSFTQVKVSNTRNEDIADNVGTKVVYFAYDTLTKGKLPERQLPGLNYSAKQMFWIGLASNWCSKYRPETERAIIYEDNHSMERFRINVPLLNIQGFADDFKCDPGTKMNPMKKCIVW